MGKPHVETDDRRARRGAAGWLRHHARHQARHGRCQARPRLRRRPLPEHLCAGHRPGGAAAARHRADRHRHPPGRRRPADARRQDRRGRQRHRRTRRRSAGGRDRQVGHPRHHRHPFAPGRVSQPGHECAQRRQRSDLAGHRAGLGRAFDLAAGPGLPRGARRRRDQPADPAGQRQPDRRARGDGEEHLVRHLPGHEIPRRAVGPEDGLRREPQARVRQQGRPIDTDGQHRRLSRGLRRCRRVHEEAQGRGGQAR